MDIQNVVKMYNEENKKLEDIAKELKVSKGTISKNLKANGYCFNKAVKQYVKETTNTGNNKLINNVSRETLNNGNNKNGKGKNCTFELPKELATALKLKATLEGKSMVDIVIKALKDTIETKYFNIK